MLSDKKRESLERIRKSFGRFGQLPNKMDAARARAEENRRNEPKVLKIFNIVTAIIAVGLGFYLTENRIWPATEWLHLDSRGEPTKLSFLLTVLVVAVPFILIRRIISAQLAKKQNI